MFDVQSQCDECSEGISEIRYLQQYRGGSEVNKGSHSIWKTLKNDSASGKLLGVLSFLIKILKKWYEILKN